MNPAAFIDHHPNNHNNRSHNHKFEMIARQADGNDAFTRWIINGKGYAGDRLLKDIGKYTPESQLAEKPEQGHILGLEVDTPSKAETAFGRVLENATGLPAGSSVSERKTAAALNELEDLARKNRVQERLAAIKEQRGKNG